MSHETESIEADVNASRHRLNDTLEALGNKLSPGQMLDEVLGLAQGQAGEFAGKLGRQVKDNPLPTLLIASGIVWLMMNSRGDGRISADDWRTDHRYRSLEEARWGTLRMPHETDDAYEERVHQAYAKTLNLQQRAGEAMADFRRRVADTVESARGAAESARQRMSGMLADAKTMAEDQIEGLGQRAAAARQGAQAFYQETPLAAGAIALAVGALIGSAAPLSGPEREGLRGLADSAARTSADLAERGARMVEENVDRSVH